MSPRKPTAMDENRSVVWVTEGSVEGMTLIAASRHPIVPVEIEG